MGEGLLIDEAVEAMEADVKTKIHTAVDKAEALAKTTGDPLDMFNHAFDEPPAHLVEQKEKLAEALAEQEGNRHG